MDFEKYLQENALLINDQLDQILSEFLNQVKKEKPKLIPFALGLINSCKGGKRIRGILVKLGYELAIIHLGGEKNALHLRGEILRVGAALEILHAAILIHDDVIDQSATRRDQPTLYKALRPEDGRVGGDHYGISQAISIGDIGLYLPIKIISESKFDNDLKIKALSYLSQIIIDTGWGQILDVEFPKKEDRSIDDAKFININKTAKYTISGPLQLGAILGGADKKLIKELGEFGESLGIAFQIRDDILDGELDVSTLDEGIEYTAKAKKMIAQITDDVKMKKLLEDLADYLVERTK